MSKKRLLFIIRERSRIDESQQNKRTPNDRHRLGDRAAYGDPKSGGGAVHKQRGLQRWTCLRKRQLCRGPKGMPQGYRLPGKPGLQSWQLRAPTSGQHCPRYDGRSAPRRFRDRTKDPASSPAGSGIHHMALGHGDRHLEHRVRWWHRGWRCTCVRLGSRDNHGRDGDPRHWPLCHDRERQ